MYFNITPVNNFKYNNVFFQQAVVTGWGATEEGGQTSVYLQEVTVPILSNAECRKSKYGATRITDNMLCAGLKAGSKDSCQV